MGKKYRKLILKMSKTTLYSVSFFSKLNLSKVVKCPSPQTEHCPGHSLVEQLQIPSTQELNNNNHKLHRNKTTTITNHTGTKQQQ